MMFDSRSVGAGLMLGVIVLLLALMVSVSISRPDQSVSSRARAFLNLPNEEIHSDLPSFSEIDEERRLDIPELRFSELDGIEVDSSNGLEVLLDVSDF